MPEENVDDKRRHKIDTLLAIKKFSVGTQLHKMPEIRYPYATKRAAGRMKPSEDERKRRSTGERKDTRRNVEILCKYMLFKNSKFTPGKMV